MALSVHEKLKEKYPGLVTIIVPRHAVRGNEVAQLISQHELSFARRSFKEVIAKDTEIYLADTMGELGLFYRLSSLIALGGSFVPVGGHNPIEPAQLDCAIVLGPYMHNFSMIARSFVAEKAAQKLDNPAQLTSTIDKLLGNPSLLTSYAQKARKLAD